MSLYLLHTYFHDRPHQANSKKNLNEGVLGMHSISSLMVGIYICSMYEGIQNCAALLYPKYVTAVQNDFIQEGMVHIMACLSKDDNSQSSEMLHNPHTVHSCAAYCQQGQ